MLWLVVVEERVSSLCLVRREAGGDWSAGEMEFSGELKGWNGGGWGGVQGRVQRDARLLCQICHMVHRVGLEQRGGQCT